MEDRPPSLTSCTTDSAQFGFVSTAQSNSFTQDAMLLPSDPDEVYAFGRNLYFGYSSWPDHKRGKILILRAATMGSVVAEGKCYFEGWKRQKDLRKAVKLYKEAALKGNANGQHHLGSFSMKFSKNICDIISETNDNMLAFDRKKYLTFCFRYCYIEGMGIEKNCKDGVSWYERASAQGHPGALCNLALCYQSGQGTQKDHKKAIQLYERAIALGQDTYAMFNLGTCYEAGEGVKKDSATAFKYYSMAANAGHADALYIVGSCYELGEGVEIELKKAIKFYKAAAALNHVRAMYNLGRLYYAGKDCSDVDYTEAVFWFTKAARLQSGEAEYNLAWHYQKGWGVAQDSKIASQWLLRSARRGVIHAQHLLSYCYKFGDFGIARDEKLFFKWCLKAAKSGHIEAQRMLGLSHKDVKQAVFWLTKAAVNKQGGDQELSSTREIYRGYLKDFDFMIYIVRDDYNALRR